MKHLASSIIKSMDLTVDPCENFYDFSCGNYVKESDLIDENSEYSEVINLEKTVNKQFRILIQSKLNNSFRPYKMARDFYSSCMNTSERNVVGFKAFLELIETTGGWPIIKGDSWNSEEFNLNSILGNSLKNLLVNFIFEFNIFFDMRTFTKNIINVSFNNLLENYLN